MWYHSWGQVIASSPHQFSDPARFKELVAIGMRSLQNDDIDGLRQVVGHLWQIQIDTGSDTDMIDIVNIIRE